MLQLFDCATGANLGVQSLGEQSARVGMRVLACGLAPDDSATVALVSTRHHATAIFLIKTLFDKAVTPLESDDSSPRGAQCGDRV